MSFIHQETTFIQSLVIMVQTYIPFGILTSVVAGIYRPNYISGLHLFTW
jgi:hypothetical protein